MEKKWIISLSVCIVIIILLGLSLFVPWYAAETKGVSKLECTLTGMEVSFLGMTETKKWIEEDAPDSMAKVYTNLFLMMIAAFILAGISLVCLIQASKGKASVKLGATFLILTMIITIIGPIYLAIAIPSAMHEDMPEWDKGFIGREEKESIVGKEITTWGPSWGWYFAIIAFALGLVGLKIVLKPSKAPKIVPIAPLEKKTE